MATKKPKGLGRGLEALLGPTAAPSADNTSGGSGSVNDAEEGGAQRNPSTLMLDQMVAGVYQPRTRMARAQTMEIISSLSDAQLARTAVFEGYGPLTMRSLVHYLCSHDQQHLAGLQWLAGKIDASTVPA